MVFGISEKSSGNAEVVVRRFEERGLGDTGEYAGDGYYEPAVAWFLNDCKLKFAFSKSIG